MAGLFSRLKIWGPSESVTNTDLNAEFNNIISNVDSEHAEGYSSNLSEMTDVEDPGGVGTENLVQPITIAQEIERLRFVVARAIGKDRWYDSPSTNLEALQDNLSQAFFISPQRVVNGTTSVNSSQPKYLQALGAGGVKIEASEGDPFAAYIDGSLITLTSDVALSGLSAAPSSGNTATLASDFTGAAQFSRAVQAFTIASAGSEIVARLGRMSSFKISNGVNTEYFIGTVTSSTRITGIQRGFVFDSSQVPSLPITLTTGHTITVLRHTYVFLLNSGNLDVSYNAPYYQSVTPTGASIGDYWYDTANDTWMRYGGSLWVQANAILVGFCAQDGASTVMARSVDFYAQFSDAQDVAPALATNTVVTTSSVPTSLAVSVYGNLITKRSASFSWDITSNLIAGETEAASTLYYLYLTEGGDPKISSLKPLLRKELKGYYHPYETYRAIGSIVNDGSSNFDQRSIDVFSATYGTGAGVDAWDIQPPSLVGEIKAHSASGTPSQHLKANGESFNASLYPRLFLVVGTAWGTASAGNFNVPTTSGYFLRGYSEGSGTDPDAASRGAIKTGGVVGDLVGSQQGDALQSHKHNTTASYSGSAFGNGANTNTGSYSGTISGGNALTDNPFTGTSVSVETRPKNVNVNYVIRF